MTDVATRPSPGRIKTYLRVPEHVLPGLVRYVESGYAPGDFLRAVLVNDLADACGRADDICGPALQDIMRFLYNVFPGGNWGSLERYKSWLDLEADERERIYKNCPDWMDFKAWYDEQEEDQDGSNRVGLFSPLSTRSSRCRLPCGT